MDVKSTYQYLLSTDGVNQLQRSLPALNPLTIQMDERGKRDILSFLIALSAQIRYYDLQNQSLGDWRPFFDYFVGSAGLMSESELDNQLINKQDWSPHLILLLAFLKAFSYAQQDLNGLTAKHLRYFYQDVLQLQRRAAQPDQVHVIFELAKNAVPTLIAKDTLLDGGKTSTGKPLQYALDSEIVVNQALVEQVKSAFVDITPSGKSIVYRADDAKAVKGSDSSSWRPLGQSQLALSPEQRNMEATSLGFAIASPALLLAEGDRTITLTLKLQTEDPSPPAPQLLSPFVEIDLTGEKGWLVPDSISAELTAGPDLVIILTFSAAAEAITGYIEKTHAGNFITSWPVVRCKAKPEAHMLETLGAFTVQTVEISVAADGLKNLVFQNDQSLQPPDKPILPFGSQPLIGSNLYIGSQEVFSKTVSSLELHLEWQDPPTDFATYYSAYSNPSVSNTAFSADLYLLAARNWQTRLLFNQSLFQTSNPTLIKDMPVLPATFNTQTAGSGFVRRPELAPITTYDNKAVQGFIKLVLTGPTKGDLGNQPPTAPFEAFGHKTFATVYTQQAIALSQFDGIGTPPELPKPPYTPTLKSVSLDYTAKETFQPSNPNGVDQFFIEDIFGPIEVQKNETARLTPVLPGQGALYIGVRNATPPQLLSFLFQVEKGDVPGAEILVSQDLYWSYLAQNGNWRELAAQDIVEDATQGLQQAGIVRVNLGNDASSQASAMPLGLYWLRLAAKQRADGAGSVHDVALQAARATLVLPDEDLAAYEQHLAQPLAALSISKLVKKITSIKRLRQDYPSFGGLSPETDDAFFRRISERLRHRNRTVSAWDYEHLILEAFPEVFKAKCLPHMDVDNTLQPGHVKIVIVPDFRKHPTGDPLQPRINAAFLKTIESYLTGAHATTFAAIHVSNPTYETLLVDCKVAFQPGFDPGFYALLLNEEIKRFLSPWAYEEGQDIVFGGKIYKSELLAFVEGRPYVDYVVDFQIYHRFTGTAGGGISDMIIGEDFIVGTTPRATVNAGIIGVDFVVGEPVEVAAATRPDTILTSNGQHRIEALQADGFACAGVVNVGIGQMVIGVDFVPIS